MNLASAMPIVGALRSYMTKRALRDTLHSIAVRSLVERGISTDDPAVVHEVVSRTLAMSGMVREQLNCALGPEEHDDEQLALAVLDTMALASDAPGDSTEGDHGAEHLPLQRFIQGGQQRVRVAGGSEVAQLVAQDGGGLLLSCSVCGEALARIPGDVDPDGCELDGFIVGHYTEAHPGVSLAPAL